MKINGINKINSAVWTLTRKELEKIRDEDLALSDLQSKIYTAKFMSKIASVEDICRLLNISKSTYHHHLRQIKMMLSRLFENAGRNEVFYD